MKKICLLPIILLLSVTASYAQTIAEFTVRSGKYARNNSVVYTTISNVEGQQLMLEEEAEGKRRQVPFTIQGTQLGWILKGETAAGKERRFILSKGKGITDTLMRVKNENGKLLLEEGRKPVLQYNYQTVKAPAGVDTLYNRSAFIHPLWAPNGVILTSIFPNKSHMHHMGIWNPWTHTSFEGRETDFWNVQKKEGKVRYAGGLEIFAGSIWCGFKASQDHIAFLPDGSEKTAINETWSVRVYPANHGGKRRLWDFSSIFSAATPNGITLLQYRYGGGFGLRTTAAFTSQTSQVLTSEGRTRKDADSTRARWVKISGATPDGKAGMLIMNYPDNFDSPEPLRVWPEDMEGGELMFNFTPTRMKSWQLSPGSRYQLKYRVMVYEGDITAEEAEAAWLDYVYPVEVGVEIVK